VNNCVTLEENVTIIRAQLHAEVSARYTAYEDNSGYVLPHHSYLFTQRSLDQRLQYSHDSIKCWLCSIEEARAILAFQQELSEGNL
jgi:hypothetical protein